MTRADNPKTLIAVDLQPRGRARSRIAVRLADLPDEPFCTFTHLHVIFDDGTSH